MSTYWVPRTQRGAFANIALWVIGLALLVGVLVAAGWRIGWWFQGKAVNYQSHILRNSYANQQTLRDQITQRLADVNGVTVQLTETTGAEQQALRAQRLSIAGIVCQDASEVTGDPLPVDQGQWVQENCLDGSVSPSSPLN